MLLRFSEQGGGILLYGGSLGLSWRDRIKCSKKLER